MFTERLLRQHLSLRTVLFVLILDVHVRLVEPAPCKVGGDRVEDGFEQADEDRAEATVVMTGGDMIFAARGRGMRFISPGLGLSRPRAMPPWGGAP